MAPVHSQAPLRQKQPQPQSPSTVHWPEPPSPVLLLEEDPPEVALPLEPPVVPLVPVAVLLPEWAVLLEAAVDPVVEVCPPGVLLLAVAFVVDPLDPEDPELEEVPPLPLQAAIAKTAIAPRSNRAILFS